MSAQPSPYASSRSPDKSLFSQWTFILLAAWMSHVALHEWEGYREGRGRVMLTLEKKQQALVANLMARNPVYTEKAFAWMHQLNYCIHEAIKEATRKVSLPFWRVNEKSLRFSESQKNWGKEVEDTFSVFLIIFIETTKLFLLKLAALMVSLELLIASLLVGAIEGYVARAVRTAEGGRESTWLFHAVSRWVGQLTSVTLIAYFLSPTVFTPERTVLVLSLTIGLFFRIVFSQFKKYG